MREVFTEDRAALRRWLNAHHKEDEGAWVVFYKGEKRTLSYDDIAEEALCFGWVDSKPGKVDSEKTKLYLAPRNPSSNWSALNKRRIEKLEAAGLLTEAGKKDSRNRQGERELGRAGRRRGVSDTRGLRGGVR